MHRILPRLAITYAALMLALCAFSSPALAAGKSKRPAAPPPAPVEVVLRHDLGGAAAAALSELVLQFNDEQKGRGIVRLDSVSAGEPAHALPQLALLDPTAAMAFFGTRPRMQPLDAVMRRAGSPLAAASLLPQLADTVDDASNRLQALPLGMSLPVLYLDVAKLRAAGIDPDNAPATWWDLQTLAGKLYEHGISCPLTSSHFSWVHLENLAAQSAEPFVARTRTQERALANGQIAVKHLALLASWQKSRYFHYFGQGSEGDSRFLGGECAMLTSATALYPAIRSAGMDVRVTALPHHGDVYGERPNDLIPDGLSLWVLADTSRAQDQLIAKLVRYFLDTRHQREWVRRSGFLPMTTAVLDSFSAPEGFSPTLFNAIRNRLKAPKPQGARLSTSAARERFRNIFGEELEPVWNADRAPKEALDRTVTRMDAGPK